MNTTLDDMDAVEEMMTATATGGAFSKLRAIFCVTLVSLLLFSASADASAFDLTLDGVRPGEGRAAVMSRLGEVEKSGALAMPGFPRAVWSRFCTGAPGGTTVSFATTGGECLRVRGARLSLGTGGELVLGESRDRAIAVLGAPRRSLRRGAQELLTYRGAGGVELTVVCSSGLVDGLSLGR